MSNSSLGEAVLDLVADGSQLIKDINKEQPKVLGALDKLGKAGGAILATGLTVAATALVGLTALIWDAGATIDGAYDKIAVSTGAVGDELEGLQIAFDTVFQNVPTNADDAATAISGLNQRLGMTGPILEETAAQMLEMTRLTGGDLNSNIEQFTRFMGDAGIANEEASSTLDTLFAASQQTGTGIDRLMQLAVQFGAPMRQFGYSWQESIAMLGKWEKEGVNTELVMGSLRIAAGKFAKENKPLKQGLTETFNAIKNAKDGSQALAIAMEVFGARAGPDMAAAIRENRFELGDLVGSLENTDGAIMKTAEATMDWGERWTIFKNRITTALGPAGMGLMEAVNTALGALEQLLGRGDVQAGLMIIVGWIVEMANAAANSLPKFIDSVFLVFGWLKDNQAVVAAALTVIGVALAAFAYTSITAAVPAMIALWTSMAPVMAIMALVAAAAYLLYEAWTNNWGGIQEKTAALWAWLQPILTQVWNWLATNVPLALQALANFWTTVLLPAIVTVWDWLATNIPLALQTLSAFWTGTLLPAIQAVWAWLSGTLFPFFQALGNFLGAVFGVAITALAGVWQNVLLPAITAVWSAVSTQLMPVFEMLANFWTNTLQPIVAAIAEWIGGAIVGAFETLSGAIRTVTDWLAKTADMLNNLTLPAWMTPGSPTPWEIGLWGVNDALKAVGSAQLPSLSAGLTAMPAPAIAGGGGMQLQAGGGMQFVYSPQFSTADEYEAERAFRPFFEKFQREQMKK